MPVGLRGPHGAGGAGLPLAARAVPRVLQEPDRQQGVTPTKRGQASKANKLCKLAEASEQPACIAILLHKPRGI